MDQHGPDPELSAEPSCEAGEHYRLLFERNPQPMWVLDRETLAFLAVNDAAVGHYGYTRDEFLALSARDIRPPEEVARFVHYVGSLTQERATPYPRYTGPWRHRRK